jgi:hypothetical protein
MLRSWGPFRRAVRRPLRATSVAGPPVAGTRRWTRGPPEADAPVTLPDLELAQARGTELRDQRWQQLTGQAVDRRMIGSPLAVVTR